MARLPRLLLVVVLANVALLPLERLWFLSALLVVQGFVTQQPPWRRRTQQQQQQQVSFRTRLFWSHQAVVDKERSIHLSSTLVEQSNNDTSTVLDLSSPRAWLQHQPAGVYTVIRVDRDRNGGDWHTWGLDFHLQRLQQSYSTLYLVATRTNSSDEAALMLQQAVQDSMATVEALLQQVTTRAAMSDTKESSIVMLTLLWHPSSVDDDKTMILQVKGHVLTTAAAAKPTVPWHVTLALSDDEKNDRLVIVNNRKDNHPECKQSSWCTDRIPLEKRFKQTGVVDEVLLMQDDKECILEGLTSNCFFVYPGKVLKTPAQGVLWGYARHRVMQAAEAMGFCVQQGPVSLREAEEWQEVFLTSAIRLIQPVQTINRIDNNDPVMVWQATEISNDDDSVATSILDTILQQEGL